MSKIAQPFAIFYSWLSSNPTCERDRTQRQILLTFPDIRLHTPGI